jgi:hypothetical protein
VGVEGAAWVVYNPGIPFTVHVVLLICLWHYNQKARKKHPWSLEMHQTAIQYSSKHSSSQGDRCLHGYTVYLPDGSAVSVAALTTLPFEKVKGNIAKSIQPLKSSSKHLEVLISTMANYERVTNIPLRPGVLPEMTQKRAPTTQCWLP